MAVPAAIKDILRKNIVDYVLIDPKNTAASHTVRSTVLADNHGKIQVIHGVDCLLDIDCVTQQLNRPLAISDDTEIKNLCNQHQFDSCPDIPGALFLETMIDQSLVKATEVTLRTGHANQLIRLKGDQLQKLCPNAIFADITIPFNQLQASSLDNTSDIQEITTAIASFTQLRIKQRLSETLELPPLSGTAQRIIKLQINPNADIQDLSNIVESDPSLAAQVVSWATSPYYAAPGKIRSVHDAIVRVLGFDLVLNLALGLSLGKTLNIPRDAAKGFTPYWEQAVYAATALETLVGVIPPKDRPIMGLAYLAGLLHNFGYLILAEVFPPHFSTLCRYQEANPYSNHNFIERHLINVTREQLGGWLMRLWHMPKEVCIALRFQNESQYDGEDSSYANLLFIAMRLLRKHGIGDAPLETIPDKLYKNLNLDPDKAETAIANVVAASEEIKNIASHMAR